MQFSSCLGKEAESEAQEKSQIESGLESGPESGAESGAESGEFSGQVTLQVTPQASGEVTGDVTGEVAGEVTGEVADEVLRLLHSLDLKPLTRAEVQSSLELKGQANFRERYLEPALASGFVEMTIQDKPRSSKQKYRLTEKGKLLIKNMRNKT